MALSDFDAHLTRRVEEKETMDQKAMLDHQFLVAAYTITWVVQLGYLCWLGLKWRSQKRDAARTSRGGR